MSASHTLEGLLFIPLMISTSVNTILFVIVAQTISPLSTRVCASKTWCWSWSFQVILVPHQKLHQNQHTILKNNQKHFTVCFKTVFSHLVHWVLTNATAGQRFSSVTQQGIQRRLRLSPARHTLTRSVRWVHKHYIATMMNTHMVCSLSIYKGSWAFQHVSAI